MANEFSKKGVIKWELVEKLLTWLQKDAHDRKRAVLLSENLSLTLPFEN